MPDSKMEKQGKAIPVNSNRSPWCVEIETQDLIIGDPDTPDSARRLLDDYLMCIPK